MTYTLKTPTYLDLAEHVPGAPYKYKHGWIKVYDSDSIVKHETSSNNHVYRIAHLKGTTEHTLYIYKKDSKSGEATGNPVLSPGTYHSEHEAVLAAKKHVVSEIKATSAAKNLADLKKMSDYEYLTHELGNPHGAKVSSETYQGKELHIVKHGDLELIQQTDGSWQLQDFSKPAGTSTHVGSYQSRYGAVEAMKAAILAKASNEKHESNTTKKVNAQIAAMKAAKAKEDAHYATPSWIDETPDHVLDAPTLTPAAFKGNDNYSVTQSFVHHLGNKYSASTSPDFQSGKYVLYQNGKPYDEYPTVDGVLSALKDVVGDYSTPPSMAEQAGVNARPVDHFYSTSIETAQAIKVKKLNKQSLSMPQSHDTTFEPLDKVLREHAAVLGGSVINDSVRVDTKIGINQRLLTMIQADPNPEVQKHIAHLVAMHGEETANAILTDNVRNMVDTWAGSSSDHTPLSLALQEMAGKMFGVGDQAFIKKSRNDLPGHGYDDQSIATNIDPVLQESFLRSTYQLTQAELVARGVPDQVVLYRGMVFGSGENGGAIPGWVTMAHESGNASAGTPTEVTNLNPLTSWASNWFEARNFSGGNKGVIIQATIPRSAIISSSLTGLGCLNEMEFVVGGIDGPALVTPRNT